MRIINQSNLDRVNAYWLRQVWGEYDANPRALSATTLLDPVRIVVLTTLFPDDMVVDVADTAISGLGTMAHSSREAAIKSMIDEGLLNKEEVFTERRLIMPFKLKNKKIVHVSGKFDLLILENGKWVIDDLKVVKVWTYAAQKIGSYYEQGATYRLLIAEGYIQENGVPGNPFAPLLGKNPMDNDGRISFLFKDHSPTQALKLWDPALKKRVDHTHLDFADHPMTTHRYPLATVSVTKKRITKKLELLYPHFANVQGMKKSDAVAYLLETLPMCSAEDKWNREGRCKYWCKAPYCPQNKKWAKLKNLK
jgi:hypothetical protein